MSKQKDLEEKLKNANQDLEDLENYIREFSDFLPLAVCTVNPLGRIVNLNKAAEILIGYPYYEITGEFVYNIFAEKEEIKKIEKEIIKTKIIHNKELTLISKKKKKIPVNLSISVRENEDGDFIGYFLAISDITEIKSFQKSLEEKVATRTKELRARLAELERFHKVTVGRELRMIELKEKVKKLQNQLKKHAKQKRS